MTEYPRTLAEKYHQSNVMTAGKIKSIQLLLARAQQLLEIVNPQSIPLYKEEIRQCKNIIAQLEMSLNLKSSETAIKIFEMYWILIL